MTSRWTRAERLGCQKSYDYIRPYWDQIGATIVGRHVFDMTDGWDGNPPGGVDHVVVVTHRPKPEGWDPEAPFQFVDGVEAAVAKAQELAGDRIVEVAAGDVGGQVLPRAWSTRCGWTSYPSCSGPASATSGAPPADLSGYAKNSTANGDAGSGRWLRLRIDYKSPADGRAHIQKCRLCRDSSHGGPEGVWVRDIGDR
ncbi:hypothetical protein GCM10009776_35850 [Microbacterium deminutum]|uniref:Uncharacterized protein n=1 Tax=Microbacterium deminutum TaxID=344164 RepID=A0ABN2RID3_9MICO